jgi:erythromycin esterase-like protein
MLRSRAVALKQSYALTQLLTSIDGQSAVISSAKWGELETAQQEKAISGVTRLKLRLASLAPVLKNHVNSDFFRKASDRIESIEYTLETLRVMKAFFDGTSLEGDTSVRDSYMAGVVDGMVRANPDVRIILLAHNNHLQKTPVSFSGELTAVPMGQHLAEREEGDYRAIAFTHLGLTVPESVRCTKHIIAHSQTIRSSLLLLFLSVHNKPYTNWEIYHERLAFSCYRNSWRSNRNIRIKI